MSTQDENDALEAEAAAASEEADNDQAAWELEEERRRAAERWIRAAGRKAHTPRVDAFLAEIVEVSRRHGLSIGHEDTGGGFLVHPFDEGNIQWLNDAAVDGVENP